jgi:hypothetical protein
MTNRRNGATPLPQTGGAANLTGHRSGEILPTEVPRRELTVRTYIKPSVSAVGSLNELTLITSSSGSNIYKQTGGTDTVHYSNGTISEIPGHGATIS